jgi:hypothetical protein
VRRAMVTATIRIPTATSIMKDSRRAVLAVALPNRFLKQIGMPMLILSLRFETWIVAIQALTAALTRRSLVRRF